MNRSIPVSLLLLAAVPVFQGFAQTAEPIRITADLSDAPRKILRAELTMPVKPGPLNLYYPEWIPGEHGPTGPIADLTGLVFSVNGQALPWSRNDTDMYEIRVNIPEGAASLKVKLEFLATAAPSGFSAGASTNSNLAVLSWNEVLLYPAGIPASQIVYEPSIRVPEGWKFGTALTSSSVEGLTTNFHPVPLTTLIDSPLLAGRFFKEVALADDVTPRHYLDMAGDGPEDLNITRQQINAFSNLIREAGALYKSHHYASYHFLLTLSDSVAHFGLEHHQSSDDRIEARGLVDEELNLLNGDLLPHEFTHSWNGKYRRPAGLVTEDYQHSMKGELLWVYEGMTQYWGDVLAARSGIWNAEQYRAYLAASAAEMDHRPGRTWRDLQDTATAAQILYDSPKAWENWRRTTDFYAEGELLWLDVDTTIRHLSNGKKSLDDFCARFLGLGGDTPAQLAPYTFEDLITELNAIQPCDWARFFHERLDARTEHAPLTGVLSGGYKIEYTDQENEFIRAQEYRDHGVNAWYSIGINTTTDNTIGDVLVGSPAYQAGLGPGAKIVAVNGRRATEDLLHEAIRDTKTGKPVELIIDNEGFVKTVRIDYSGGEKYPRLVRTQTAQASLDKIIKPLTEHSNHAQLAKQ